MQNQCYIKTRMSAILRSICLALTKLNALTDK